MRYFRYHNTNKNYKNALKAQYKKLTEDEKRTARKEKQWRTFSNVVTVIVFMICTLVAACLIVSIQEPEGWFLRSLVIAIKALFGSGLLIINGFVTYFLTKPFWKKVESFHIPSMKKEIFAKACAHLRKYYKLQEPYIVTKCLDATDRHFKNHDVCIFIVGNELRITADLVRGFLHGERDLGCYAFKREEITLSKLQDGAHLVVELRAGDTAFTLGYRAKGFIEKQFIAKGTE